MDHQIDQLSVDVTNNMMFTKGGNEHSLGKMEIQSMVSVITKGGTEVNPFG